MANHVTVREIQADVVVFSALDGLDYLVCDFGALHPRTLLKRNDIARNLNVVFKFLVEFALLVSVEEVGDVSVFLCLADCKQFDACLCQVFAHRAVDARRVHEVLCGNMGVAVVFHHACIFHGRNAHAVKRKVSALGCLERTGNLKRTVSAEVEVNYAVAVLNCSDRFSIFCNHELMHILVKQTCVFRAVGFDCLCRALKFASFAQNMSLPAALHHAPVRIVAVHRHVHASAARSNLIVHAAKARQEFFQRSDVVECGSGVYVASVQKRMDTEFLYAVLVRLCHHCLQVVDVAVHVSVRNQTDEVQCAVLFVYILDEFLPCCGGKHRAVCN